MEKKSLLLILVIGLVFFSFSVITLAQESRGPYGPLEKSTTTGRETIGEEKFEVPLFQKVMNNPLTWIFLILTIFYYINYRKTKKHNIFLVAIIGLPILILLSPANIRPELPADVNTDWQINYKTEIEKFELSKEYFEETEYFDYSSPIVQEVVSSIKNTADNEYDAVQKSLDYVYYHIDYNINEDDTTCFNAKASTVLEKKSGQCDTQSITLITILRGLGFAARSTVGCVYKNSMCLITQTVFAEPIRDPIYFTKLITVDDYQKKYKGRGSQTISRAGGLHAWAEVFMPDRGWMRLEATSGEIAENTCYYYNIEMYPTGPDAQSDICICKDISYAQWCYKQ